LPDKRSAVAQLGFKDPGVRGIMKSAAIPQGRAPLLRQASLAEGHVAEKCSMFAVQNFKCSRDPQLVIHVEWSIILSKRKPLPVIELH
jgi:hypothetical protein